MKFRYYICLILTFIIFMIFFNKSRYSSNQKFLISNIDIDKIILEEEKNKIVLVKKDFWYLTAPVEHLANQKEIEDIINLLKNSKIEHFVTDSKSQYKNFKLDQQCSKLQIFKKNNLLKEIFIGKNDTNIRKSYVRIDDKIYLVDSMISSLAYLNPNGLIDKRIFKLSKENIIALTIKTKNSQKDIVRKNNNFYVNGTAQNNLEELIQKVLNLEIYQIREQKQYKNSYLDIKIKDHLNNEYFLSIFKEDEDLYAKLNNIYFSISKDKIEEIEKFK